MHLISEIFFYKLAVIVTNKNPLIHSGIYIFYFMAVYKQTFRQRLMYQGIKKKPVLTDHYRLAAG